MTASLWLGTPMTNSDWHTRPRDQHELDLESMRRNLQSRDWVTTMAVLALIDIAEEPQALDLICDVVEMRAGGAGEAELQAWGARAREFLRRLICDARAGELRLSNGSARIQQWYDHGTPVPKTPMTKAALERALAEIHPDRETALELVKLGIYRVRRDGRLHNGKCEAHARSTGKPCQAPAMENGRCKLHGGKATGIRSEAGRKRWLKAVRAYWVRWRLENGLPAQSWRERRAAAHLIAIKSSNRFE